MQAGVAMHRPQLVPNRPVPFKKSLIFSLSRITLSEIILTRFAAMEQRIRIRQNQCVLTLYSPFHTQICLPCPYQSELEHRKPKSRYKRTDKKSFVKQLAQIDRREARLRRINAKLPSSRRSHRSRWLKAAQKPIRPQIHHHIGRFESNHEHIGTFLRQRSGDPAVQVRAQIVLRHLARPHALPGFSTKPKAAHFVSCPLGSRSITRH